MGDMRALRTFGHPSGVVLSLGMVSGGGAPFA